MKILLGKFDPFSNLVEKFPVNFAHKGFFLPGTPLFA
jgi:hypothetical protein